MGGWRTKGSGLDQPLYSVDLQVSSSEMRAVTHTHLAQRFPGVSWQSSASLSTKWRFNHTYFRVVPRSWTMSYICKMLALLLADVKVSKSGSD